MLVRLLGLILSLFLLAAPAAAAPTFSQEIGAAIGEKVFDFLHPDPAGVPWLQKQGPPDEVAIQSDALPGFTARQGCNFGHLFSGSGAYGASGCAAQTSFDAPLQTSLVPVRALGSSTPTFTRALAAYQTDFEGKLNLLPSGAARMQGARIVYNQLANGGVFKSGGLFNGWTKTGTPPTSVTDGLAGPSGSLTAAKIIFGGNARGIYTIGGNPASWTGVIRLALKGDAAGAIRISFANSGGFADVNITTSWATYSVSTSAATALDGIAIVKQAGQLDTVYVDEAQIENVTGQTNQNPSEYVSVGVLSAPYHGLNVDGIKAFSTLNGNTIASNVVTEATGAAINSSNAKFAVLDGVATSYFSTPNTTATSQLGNHAIEVHDVVPPDWTPALDYILVSDYVHSGGVGTTEIQLGTTGVLKFIRYNSTPSAVVYTSSAGITVADGTALSIRAVFVLDNGAGKSTVTFGTSNDHGSTWTQLGNVVESADVTAGPAGTGGFHVGHRPNLAGNNFLGRIGRVLLRDSTNAVVMDFNPNLSTTAQTFTAATGEVWTTNGTARIFGNTHATYGIPAQFDSGGNLGYLSEGARTNTSLANLTYSNATYWTALNTTLTDNNAVAPDGTTTASLYATTNTGAALYQANTKRAALSTGTPYTVSVFVKPITAGKFLYLAITDAVANEFGSWLNLDTGIATGTARNIGGGVLASATTKRYPNGWILFSVTGQSSAWDAGGAGTNFNINPADNNITTANGNSVYLWISGVEAGSFVSSPIPTTTAAVARPADVLTYPSAGNYSSTGTMYAEYAPMSINNYGGVLAVDDGSQANEIVLAQGATGSAAFWTMDTASANQGTAYYGTPVVSAVNKIGISYKTNNVQPVLNGVLATADTTATTPTSLTRIAVGQEALARPLYGTIRNVRIYPVALNSDVMIIQTAKVDLSDSRYLIAANDERFRRAVNQ